MTEPQRPRRGSIGGALVLIAVGVAFLYLNLRPDLDAWSIVRQWWPLILIFWGLGKMLDYFWTRRHPESAGAGISGGSVALIVLLILFGVALARSRHSFRMIHETQTVERQGAEAVSARLEMPAGELKISGGSSHLLEAEFNYDGAEGKPRVQYSVSGGRGSLSVDQPGPNVHIGNTRNNWDLRFSNDVPLELRLNMGAGEGDLRLRGTSLTSLDVNMGAGTLTADLTGDWKKDVQVSIHGGVGTARIRLPKNVGVRVHAKGGIGTIDTHGLEREGAEYVNKAYGKSPVTMRVNVEGGIGTIDLDEEP
jgi:hypothetical protein